MTLNDLEANNQNKCTHRYPKSNLVGHLFSFFYLVIVLSEKSNVLVSIFSLYTYVCSDVNNTTKFKTKEGKTKTRNSKTKTNQDQDQEQDDGI